MNNIVIRLSTLELPPRQNDDLALTTVPGGEHVERVVGLAHLPDVAAESVRRVLAVDHAAVLVDGGNGELDASVVLARDEAVGGSACRTEREGLSISFGGF